MAAVILLVTFFLLHLIVIVGEKGKRCWAEKKFWATVVFALFLIGIAVYGNSCTKTTDHNKPARVKAN